MKKYILLLIIPLFMVLLACELNNDANYNEILTSAYNELNIIYASGDNADSVKTDVTLVDSLDITNYVVNITWESNKEEALTSSGVVTRSNKNVNVTLKATLTINTFSKTKVFILTIKANEIVDASFISLSVVSLPNKVQYQHGESFDPTGLVVRGLFRNKTESYYETLSLSDLSYKKDPLNEDDAKFSISANLCGVTKYVEIDLVILNNYELVSFVLIKEPNQLSYYLGDTFNPTGIILELTYKKNDVLLVKQLTEKDIYFDETVISASTTFVYVHYIFFNGNILNRLIEIEVFEITNTSFPYLQIDELFDSELHLLYPIPTTSNAELEVVLTKHLIVIINDFTLNDVNAYIELLIDFGFLLVNDIDSDYQIYKKDNLYIYMYYTDQNYAVFGIYMNSGYIADPAYDYTVGKNLKIINTLEFDVSGFTGMITQGEYHIFVVPVEIKGFSFGVNDLTNLDLVFNGTSEQTGWESVASYYKKSSHGKLDITFDIAEKYTTKYSYTTYQNSMGDHDAMKEALDYLNPSIDFSDYDFNSDGYIDSVIFIYSKAYNYNTDPWWAWCWLYQYSASYDNVTFKYYQWASIAFMYDSLGSVTLNAETYIHETGHLLGLEDYYSTYNNGGMGGFDMMDWNCGDHGPFNKILFGWINPIIHNTSTDYELEKYVLNSSTILIPRSNTYSNSAFDEYLLIMYYTPEELYSAHLSTGNIPTTSGIVIYHIDARLSAYPSTWNYYVYDNQSSTSKYLIRILEADTNSSITSYGISNNDLLRSGSVNLSSYKWNQGGNIQITISINNFNTNSVSITIS